jgi:signal transduction histidine kinase
MGNGVSHQQLFANRINVLPYSRKTAVATVKFGLLDSESGVNIFRRTTNLQIQRCLNLLLFILLANSATLLASAPIPPRHILSDYGLYFSHGKEFLFLQDSSGTLRAEDVLKSSEFKIAEGQTFLGRTADPVWFYFEIEGDSAYRTDTTQSRNSGFFGREWTMYFFSNFNHKAADFYFIRDGHIESIQRTGTMLPLAERSIPNRRLGVTLDIGKGEVIGILVRLESSATLRNDIRVIKTADFIKAGETNQLLFGFYIGLIVLSAILSFAFSASIGDSTYAIYGAFCISVCLIMFVFNGYWDVYVSSLRGSSYLLNVFSFLSIICAATFTRSLLQTKIHFPKLDRIFISIIGVEVLTVIMRSVPSINIYTDEITGIAVLAISGACMITGILAVHISLPHARYYLASWGLLTTAASISILGEFGLISFNMITMNAVVYGQIAETIILNYAMIDRVRLINSLKITAEVSKKEADGLKTFLRIVSHDLVNPITATLGYLEIAKSVPGANSETVKFLNKAQKSTLSQLGIIRNVGKMRAVEDGKQKLEMLPVDILDALEEVRTLFTTVCAEKGIEIVVTGDDLFHACILGDRISLVHNILANVVGNAIKFSFPGGKINISVRFQEPFSTLVVIADDGVGMPAEIVNNLFSKEVPTTRKGTSGESGTGFGMPLVESFLKGFQGEIFVESTEKSFGAEKSGTIITLVFKTAVSQKSA